MFLSPTQSLSLSPPPSLCRKNEEKKEKKGPPFCSSFPSYIPPRGEGGKEMEEGEVKVSVSFFLSLLFKPPPSPSSSFRGRALISFIVSPPFQLSLFPCSHIQAAHKKTTRRCHLAALSERPCAPAVTPPHRIAKAQRACTTLGYPAG